MDRYFNKILKKHCNEISDELNTEGIDTHSKKFNLLKIY